MRRRSQHTAAVMWPKLRVETEIEERGSTAEQPLCLSLCPLDNAPLDVCILRLNLLMSPPLMYTHTETTTPSRICSSLKHTCTHTLNTTPPPLAGTIKLHPALSALSHSHVPILERNCSLPLNPTVADSINEVASQPKALHNTPITSVRLA